MKDRVKNYQPARLGIGWGAALTVPLAAAETLLALFIQPGDLLDLCRYFLSQPLLAFLNFLPFWLLTLCCYFLWANPFFAAACVGAAGGLLSLVNRTMVEKRDEPLSPKDFALLKEAGDAARSYGMDLHLFSILGTLLFIGVMVGLGFLFRGKRPFARRWQNLCLALAGAAASFGVLFGCIQGVYSSRELYESFPVKDRYYIAGVYNQMGFPYCFCYNFNTYLVEKPEGFSARRVKEYIAEHPAERKDPKNVNVVIVMNEAFSDVTAFEAFDYPESEDPLKFYKTLKERDDVIAGHIVVPNFGAGTANTEFDVISGMQTCMLSEVGTSAFRVLNHDMDSIFRVFSRDGYATEFIHPGQDWFYNRQNVYKYFGAQELLFSEDFKEAERKGGWVTDDAVLLKMKERFETAMERDEPYFNFTVTIQNHMSYTKQKYGEDYPLPDAPLKKEVSDDAKTMLSVYAEGVRDSDEMLRGLVEYFSGREEPVVLVFFGDHLPNLGNNYLAYTEMGMAIGEGGDVDTVLRTYKTPYVIWCNEPAAKELDFAAVKQTLDLPEDNVINANYLGALTLELVGRRDEDGFFSYLNDMRRELPILHNNVGRTGDGEYFIEIPPEYADEVEKLHFWEYYKLKVE